jgi:hypothetical protein
MKTLQFRKRARLGHYSLYAKGCRFDKVEKVAQVSQAGAIPASWLELAGWSKAIRSRGPYEDPGDPPDEFWRTIVADRGMNDRNPPYYYMRACKETIMKGGLRSNAVDTGALIHNERNSIVAEFCRRVQAVIWNRALIKTRSGALGLASERVKVGDWICIIYGCTVPVILRKEGWKKKRELEDEKIEDCIETWAKNIRIAAKQRARKARYNKRKDNREGEAEVTWEEAVKNDLADYKRKLEELRKKEVAKYEQKLKDLGNGLSGSKYPDEKNDLRRENTEKGTDRLLGNFHRTEETSPAETNPSTEDNLTSLNGVKETNQAQTQASSKPDLDTPNDDTDEDRSENEQQGQGRKPRKQRSESSERKRDKKRQEDAERKDPFRYYSFLGEAYIHGMMDGEAMRQNFQKAKPDHVFEIR